MVKWDGMCFRWFGLGRRFRFGECIRKIQRLLLRKSLFDVLWFGLC